MTALDQPLALRKALGRDRWGVPSRHGPDGWVLRCREEPGSIIVSRAPLPDDGDREWVHASIAFDDRDPTYRELAALGQAVFREGWAYQVFAPSSEHVNIHEHALHLWGRDDGSPALPNFAPGGSI